MLLIVGAAMPFLLVLIPIEHIGAQPGEGGAFVVLCLKCFSFGLVFGLPVLLLAYATRRANVDGAGVVALAGVAAALTGNLALHLHCPVTDVAHIMLGHASLVFFLGLTAALLMPACRVWRSLRSRSTS